MATDYVNKHAVSGVSKLLATNGGAHIYNVTLSTVADNGNIIGRGDMVSLDNYAEATPTTFKGKIVWKASNGNWYVEVLEADNALLVYNVPINADEKKREQYFYNEVGDVARAHELVKGDIFELSAEGFSGSPTKGASITTITGKKLVIA